jgi:hypothetical protein
MENTSFNYQPRDPQAQINWAEATSNLGNVFKEEARVRTEKKAAIDEATRQYQKELAKGVPGESTSIREWGLNYAGEAQEQMAMLTTLLKSGQMSVSDYTKNKQNLVDGTEEAFSLMDDYQKEYAVKMERLQSEDPANASQRLESWVMENVEGFGNFNKTQLIVDPATGKVMAAKKILNEETGLMEISKDPNDLVPVSALKNNIISKFNKYDVEKNTKQWTANLALMTDVTRTTGTRKKAGEILTIVSKIPAQYDKTGNRIMNKISPEMAEDYDLDKEAIGALNAYIEAEDSWIDGQLSNPYNMTSIMTDYVNNLDDKEVSFTFNQEEAKKNPNLILMKRDAGGTPIPVFDESINPNAARQKEEIRQYMKYAIRTKVGETKDIKTYKDWNAMPAHYDSRYWNRGDKTKDPEAELENVEDAYVRILKDEILPISEGVNIFLDDEDATALNLRNVLNTQLNLEGFSVTTAIPGSDVVEVRDSKNELVKSFDLDDIDASTAEKYMYDIYDISSTYANKDQVVFQVSEKRLSKEEGDKKSKERRAQRYGTKDSQKMSFNEWKKSTGKTSYAEYANYFNN